MNESRENALENELFDAVEEAHRLTAENARLMAELETAKEETEYLKTRYGACLEREAELLKNKINESWRGNG